MNELIRLRLVDKRYLCVVHGRPEPETATLRNYLKKDEKRNLVEVYDRPALGALTALTRYRVIETRGRFSLLEAELLTGRTHQIRAQLAHIGHPLLGDAKYGVNRDNRGTGYRFQALYAYRLTFLEAPEAGHLSYLCGKSFEVKDISFRTDFCACRIV
jgi:23S rRNA pseudouridine955/2504/2580 synthase